MAAKAAVAWQPGTRDAYAHLRRADFSDDRSALPPEELQVHGLGQVSSVSRDLNYTDLLDA